MNQGVELDNREIVSYVGRLYKNAKCIVDMYEMNETSVLDDNYMQQKALLNIVDRILLQCDSQSRFLLKNVYFKNNEKKWYQQYYASSTYYRLKKKAVDEFVELLDSFEH